MFEWFDKLDPLWFSLGPLILVNGLALTTVLIFAFLRKNEHQGTSFKDFENKHHSKLLSKWFKDYWYWLTAPFVTLAVRFKLTPNFFTTLGFLISAFSGFAFSQSWLGVAGWAMILAGTCDTFDGRVARATGKTSEAGAFFDSVMDRFGEMACLIGLAGFYRHHWMLWFVLAAISGSMMVSYTRARGQSIGVDCQEGFMQRPERIVYLGVGAIFSPIVRHLLSTWIPTDQEYLLMMSVILIAVLTNVTAVHRMFWVLKRLDQAPSSVV